MNTRITYKDTAPGFADGLMKTEFYLKKSSLDQQLLELMKYRVSQINGCAYCLDMHHKEAVSMGETELRLHSLIAWKECPYYSDRERAVLAFAEALTLASGPETEDAAFDALTPHFSIPEIADLTLAIAQINTWNRINKTFKPVPGGYQVGKH